MYCILFFYFRVKIQNKRVLESKLQDILEYYRFKLGTLVNKRTRLNSDEFLNDSKERNCIEIVTKCLECFSS